MKLKLSIFILFIFFISCTKTNIVKDTIKLNSKSSKKVYQETNVYAIHLFFGTIPIVGNANFENSMNEFIKETNKNKKTNVQFFHKETTRYWYILPPISIIITPMNTELIGELED